MKTQKELKNVFLNIVKNEVWKDEKMVDYERKNCAYVVELSDGSIIRIEKPSIKKHFCFSYGFCGISTQEEENSANEMANYASKNTDYFINENMKPLNNQIDALKKCLEHYSTIECYVFNEYCGQPEGSKLKGYRTTNICENPNYEPGYWSNCTDLKKIDADDIQAIIDGLEEVKKSFAKRLQTYLKKYGLSNVAAWSFLSD